MLCNGSFVSLFMPSRIGNISASVCMGMGINLLWQNEFDKLFRFMYQEGSTMRLPSKDMTVAIGFDAGNGPMQYDGEGDVHSTLATSDRGLGRIVWFSRIVMIIVFHVMSFVMFRCTARFEMRRRGRGGSRSHGGIKEIVAKIKKGR